MEQTDDAEDEFKGEYCMNCDRFDPNHWRCSYGDGRFESCFLDYVEKGKGKGSL